LEATGRVMCEVINVITELLRLASSSAVMKQQTADMTHELKNGLLYVDDNVLATRETLNLPELLNLPYADNIFTTSQLRAGMIDATVSLLSALSSLYFRNTDLLSYPELFSPSYLLLSTLTANHRWPAYLQEHLEDVENKIGIAIQRKLGTRSMLSQKKRPTPISMRNPRFQEHYIVGKDYDPDSTRAELHKLKRKHQREMKGAAREIRKDTAFLQERRVQSRKKELAERATNEKRILGLLADQQGELNKLARDARKQHAFVSS